MGVFFVYILKTAVCLAGFYLFYRLLLGRETFHRFNRSALLGLLVLSCLVPLVEVTARGPMEVVGHSFVSLEEMLLIAGLHGGVVEDGAMSAVFTWREAVLLCYLLGILFFMGRCLWSVGKMLRLIRRCRKERLAGGFTLYVHREEVAPFSWMRSIIISEADLRESGKAIVTHECAHIRHCHSWDLLLAEVCIFFQWFNPAAWLLKQELQNIHEYEADEDVIRQGIDARSYQLLLIKKAVGERLYSIANSFNHSTLKKRITMMIKKKSNPWARLKLLYVLPLTALAVAAFARPEVSDELDEISSVKVNDLASIIKIPKEKSVEKLSDEAEQPSKAEVRLEEVTLYGYASDGVGAPSADPGKRVVSVTDIPRVEEPFPTEEPDVKIVDEMPRFPGGMQEAMDFICKHIRYPVEAQEAGRSGRVIVRFTVKKDGSLADFTVMRSASPELDAEAIRVLATMPNWIPGKLHGKAVAAKFTLPINFRLQ